jgi:hypothetical protein
LFQSKQLNCSQGRRLTYDDLTANERDDHRFGFLARPLHTIAKPTHVQVNKHVRALAFQDRSLRFQDGFQAPENEGVGILILPENFAGITMRPDQKRPPDSEVWRDANRKSRFDYLTKRRLPISPKGWGWSCDQPLTRPPLGAFIAA